MRIAVLVLGLLFFFYCLVAVAGFVLSPLSNIDLVSTGLQVTGKTQDLVYFAYGIYGVGILSAFGAAFSLKYPKASTYFYSIAFAGSLIVAFLVGNDIGKVSEYILKMLPLSLISLLFAIFSFYGNIELKKEIPS